MSSVKSSFIDLAKAINNSWRGRARQIRDEIDLIRFSRSHISSRVALGRIALVSGYVTQTPPVGYGGVERSFYYLAKYLSACGWDVHLWGKFQKDKMHLYDGITLHDEVDIDGFSILRIKPDILYQAYPNYIRTRRILGRTRCAVINEFNAIESLPATSDAIYIRCMNQLYADIALSRGYRPDQIICLPLFQDRETWYDPSVKREEWILWLGRADSCKALEDAYRFSQLTGIEVRFACRMPDISTPGYARALWTLMPESVSYIGEVTADSKQYYFSRCRALLYTAHPSLREAFGLIFLDALASGTPVLAVDHHSGSTQESFFPGPPYGIRARSVDELACLYSKHESLLDPEAVASKYLEIYGNDRVHEALESRLRRLACK